jgi:LysR family transcriptional regulator, glycine cleavage system transcriptional activator
MPRPRQISIGLDARQKIYCKFAARCCDNGRAMTYLLPPLNPLRAFEAASRHLSFKLAARELHVTPGAVSQQVKALEGRLGVRLFERLHRQLVLTPAGRDYVLSVRDGFRRIADATARLKPRGVAAVLTIGAHPRFDLGRLAPDHFRAANPTIGLRIVQPAGLHELTEGKVDALIDRSLGHHPGHRCDRLEGGSGVAEYLICPEGTASCPEIESLRAWLRNADAAGRVARFPRVTVRGL